MIPLEKGDPVLVKTNGQTASKRTRNRVKENGPEFTFIRAGTPSLPSIGSGPAVLLESQRTRWMGWLPAGEISVSRP